MRIVAMPIKGELEHAHSWQGEFVPQGNHIRSDKSEVLSNEWQMAKFALDCLEEIRSRTLNPMAVLGRPGIGSNMPRRAKSSKMVEPHQVYVSQQRFQPSDAPAVAGATQRVPIIHRIAPQLYL